MEKYSVLLVDDEEEVIQVIMKKIDWNALGFAVIGSASNGVRALEMAEKYQPDVVMTDIKMPYMDGLELARRLKKEMPTVRILLFTGFDEFEYAKEAVHLEVEEYILKPVNSQELTEVFGRLKKTLDQDREEKRSVEKLQTYYEESLPLLQANFFSSLIEGRIQEDELPRYLSDYRIDLSGPWYCISVFHTSSHHVPENISPLLLSMSVQKQVQERLGEKWRGKFFTYLGNTVMLAQLAEKGAVSELTDDCDRFCRSMQRIMGAETTAGIGKVFGTFLRPPPPTPAPGRRCPTGSSTAPAAPSTSGRSPRRRMRALRPPTTRACRSSSKTSTWGTKRPSPHRWTALWTGSRKRQRACISTRLR